MPDYYINGSQSASGSGSIINPYNGFTEVNSLAGDLGGATISIKANGASIRDILQLTSCSNFTVSYYGDGELATILGSDLISGGWIYDAAKSAWYIPSINNRALYGNGVQMIDVATSVELVANNSWFDSVNSRIYVILDGIDPSTVLFEANVYDAARNYCATLDGCSSFTAEYISAKYGWAGNIQSRNSGNNGTIRHCLSQYAGGWAPAGRDGIVVYGASAISPGVDWYIHDNQSDYNQNNCIEMWAIDKAYVEDNTGESNGNGLEMWGHVTNSKFSRNKIFRSKALGTSSAHGCGTWVTGPTANPDTDGNTNLTYEANLFVSCDEAGSLCEGAGPYQFRQNTYYQGVKSYVQASFNNAGATVEFSNNIMSEGLAGPLITTVSGVTITGDNNCYYKYGGGVSLTYQGTFYGNWASYKAAAAPMDANAINADPLFADAANDDFTLQSGSPCLNSGGTWWGTGVRTKTLSGELVDTQYPAIGAYQPVGAFYPVRL